MDAGGGGSAERALAAAMRRALREARWSPEDDAEQAMAVLERLIDDITSVVDDPVTCDVNLDTARTVFDSEPLGNLYAFAAGMKKTVDQRHPAQGPEGRKLSRQAFVRRAAGAFPEFHRMQRELSEALDAAYPPEDDCADDGTAS